MTCILTYGYGLFIPPDSVLVYCVLLKMSHDEIKFSLHQYTSIIKTFLEINSASKKMPIGLKFAFCV